MCISVEYKVCCSLFPQADSMNINDGILPCQNPGTNNTHSLTLTFRHLCVNAQVHNPATKIESAHKDQYVGTYISKNTHIPIAA